MHPNANQSMRVEHKYESECRLLIEENLDKFETRKYRADERVKILARMLRKLGMRTRDISEMLDVHVTTINIWLRAERDNNVHSKQS